MNTKYFLLVFLLACKPEAVVEETLPIELIECSHPDSRFEGVIQVSIEDNVAWTNVQFSIQQGEYSWETNLQKNTDFSWSTRMQLYELDCLEEFEYNVIYEDPQWK